MKFSHGGCMGTPISSSTNRLCSLSWRRSDHVCVAGVPTSTSL